jgi:histidinol-phosphate/aromatic aminotransferase/cobyric acid decarboxylase-like protein/choline kinase
MQAIILAAGMGKRLGDLTRANTKCMVQVNNRTLIERMLSHLKKIELQRIIIVVGYMGENVKNYIGDSVDGIPVTYLENEVYDKTNNIYSLSLAKELLKEDDTLLLESDLIIEEEILHRLIADSYPNLAVVAKFESWMDGTVVTLDEKDNILSFVPKTNFRHQDIPLYFKTVNIYKFSKEFSASHYVPFLDAYCRALGNNEYYEQVLRVITLLEKPDIKALRLASEKWYEIDDIQDLDNAETIFAEPEEKLEAYKKRRGGYWRYPELLDFSNPANFYFPTEIVKKEMAANFEMLLSSHPSDREINRLLAAKNFSLEQKYVVVHNDMPHLINTFLQINGRATGVISPFDKEHYGHLAADIIPFDAGANNSFTVDQLIKFFGEKQCTQLLLASPHSLTGKCIPRAELVRLLDWAALNQIRIILDESYIDFSDSNETMLTNTQLEKYPNVFVVRDIGVSQGIPGLKLAIGASGDQHAIDTVNRQMPRFGINSIAEFYMQIIGKYEKQLLNAREKMINQRESMYQELKKLRYLEPLPSQANFILCRVSAEIPAEDIARRLLSGYNILAQHFDEKDYSDANNYLRFSVRDENDNGKLINALRRVID